MIILNLLVFLMAVSVIFILVNRWTTGPLDMSWHWTELALNIGLLVCHFGLYELNGKTIDMVLVIMWSFCAIANGMVIHSRLNEGDVE